MSGGKKHSGLAGKKASTDFHQLLQTLRHRSRSAPRHVQQVPFHLGISLRTMADVILTRAALSVGAQPWRLNPAADGGLRPMRARPSCSRRAVAIFQCGALPLSHSGGIG